MADKTVTITFDPDGGHKTSVKDGITQVSNAQVVPNGGHKTLIVVKSTTANGADETSYIEVDGT